MLRLRDALRETLQGWREDIDPAWQDVVANVRLDFDGVSSDLRIEPWEPIFPTRRNRRLPGEPDGAHILRAFDGVPPEEVRCVLLGQDPYPCPAFSTGRAFEAGNTANWRELDKMASRSVRAFMLQTMAARSGCPGLASTFGNWPALLTRTEDGKADFEAPSELVDRWQASGVLPLNSSLTLSRFQVDVDPHQSKGHLIVWRPLIQAVLRRIAARKSPSVIIAFGDAAAENMNCARVEDAAGVLALKRPHPAFADAFLACENPFLACNDHLRRTGAEPVDW